MNVELMTMDRATAREKLKAYRRKRHADAEEVYSRCEAAFAALAEGTPVVDLSRVFEVCPVDGYGRPKLAVARADRKQVMFETRIFPERFCFDTRRDLGRSNDSLCLQFSGQRFHSRERNRGYATVPMVPADVRPQTGQLRDWFVLFEVEQWSDTPIIDPPRDPFLLSHIGGTLYAVLAQWDLTEIERAVMREVLQS